MSKLKFTIALALLLVLATIFMPAKLTKAEEIEYRGPRTSTCNLQNSIFWQNSVKPKLNVWYTQAEGKLINPWEPTMLTNVVVPAGTYNLEAYSYDGYKDRHFQNQPNESYYILFRSTADNSVVFKTTKTEDLADPTDKDWAETTTNFSNIVLPVETTMEFEHIGGQGPGSVIPLDMCLSKALPLPTCSISAKVININNREVEFQINNATNLIAKSFVINFGDGATSSSITNKVTHAYSKDGKYDVNVKYVYNYYGTDTEVTCSTNIEIKSPVTIVESSSTTTPSTPVKQPVTVTEGLANTGTGLNTLFAIILGSGLIYATVILRKKLPNTKESIE